MTPGPVAHPLARILTDASRGAYPPADGAWQRLPPWRPGVEGIVALTGHAYLAVGDDVADGVLEALPIDGFGGAHDPRVILTLCGDGWMDSLDVLVAGSGIPAAEPLVARPDLADHPRVRYAAALRDDVIPYSIATGLEREAGVVIVSRGIGGLREVSVEVTQRFTGLGRRLLSAARGLWPEDEIAVAAVAPGNAASLRAFLAAGFAPIGSVQVYRPVRGPQ
ncbi:MAG: hypothetical protein ACTHK1_15650 [Actinomycetales bacterium]